MAGRATPHTIRAVAWDVDGAVAAFAGWFIVGGTVLVFSDIRAGLDVPKIAIWRAAKTFMAELKMPAICVAEETSGPFLERLGWTRAGRCAEGEVYAWRI